MSAAPAPGRPLPLPTTSTGRPILSRADLDAYDPAPRRAGGRERFFCPIHGGDHQRSLTLNPETGQYTCHSCGARGTLRDHWPQTSQSGKPHTPRVLSIEDIGRRALEARKRSEADRAARMHTNRPESSTAFLEHLKGLQEEMSTPDNPGVLYLRRRGLDPAVAVRLDVGYAPPNAWPGDRDRRVGRVVYPLADPETGRVVSAMGRLCLDMSETWPEKVRATFKDSKQRKLTGCPAGVWPYTSIAAAVEHGRPLVLVEGPADALALLQRAPTLAVVALCGTASVLPTALLRELMGVVVALDADGPGAAAATEIQVQCALAGVAAVRVPAGWLGEAKDAGELAQRLARGEDGADEAYAQAVAAVAWTCAELVASLWDDARADALVRATIKRCGALYDAAPEPRPSPDDLPSTDVIDAACAARDWPALRRAVKAYEEALASVVGTRPA